MEGSSTREGPPASQSFPLFYIYRRIGHPVPLIPLDELPLWFSVDGRDYMNPWWLKDMLPAGSSNLHKTEPLPAKPSTALICDKGRKDIFLPLLDPETKEEILKTIYRYVPKMSGSQLEKFPFHNEFMRQMMASRCSEFKPKTRLYDPKSPVQRFYLGHGIYPYLWGVFGEVIVFPYEEPLPRVSGSTPKLSQKRRQKLDCTISRWLSGEDTSWGYIKLERGVQEPLLEDVKDDGPILPPGIALGEVPLRKTISASEYLTTGPMGGKPEGLSEGVSLAAGVEFLFRVMGKGVGGSWL